MSGESNGQIPNALHAWLYVFLQTVLLALLVFFNRHTGPQVHRLILLGAFLELLGILGVFICAASLRRSLTAVPIPKEDGQLTTSGLYRYVRHPMYTSVLLLSVGIAMGSGSVIKYFLVVALFVLFYFKSVYEEKYLTLKYPEYAQYSAKIRRF